MANREPLRRAEDAMRNGKFADAARLCDDFLAKDPSDAKAIYLKAQAMSNLERDEEALALFDQALQASGPASDLYPRMLHAKGNTLLWMNRLDEAEKCYDQALNIEPGLARAWIEKARIAYRQQQFPQSVRYCDNALSINPSSARAWNNKAAALLELGKTDECIVCAQSAIELKPEYPMAWVCLYKAYEKKGDKKRAQKCQARAQECLQKGVIFEDWE